MTPQEFKSTVKFIALEPAVNLSKMIQAYKDTVFALVGEQLFLHDPPHLTAYLAAFPTGLKLMPRLRAVFETRPAPTIEIVGWHVFEGDQLTGQNTLVCEIAERDKETLREWQARIIDTLAPLRDVAATEARFAARWEYLSAGEKANIRRHGFPYTGAIWQPHLTIASIRLDDWAKVHDELNLSPPSGRFHLSAIHEYELVENHPQLRDVLDLVKV